MNELKYQFLIKKREDVGITAFTEYSQCLNDVYNNLNYYNSDKNRKILIAFDDLITDIMTNKKLQVTINELFIRYRKLNVSFVFITQSYFPFPKELRLNFTHYLIMKVCNKRELRNIAINHSVDLDYKNVMNI